MQTGTGLKLRRLYDDYISERNNTTVKVTSKNTILTASNGRQESASKNIKILLLLPIIILHVPLHYNETVI